MRKRHRMTRSAGGTLLLALLLAAAGCSAPGRPPATGTGAPPPASPAVPGPGSGEVAAPAPGKSASAEEAVRAKAAQTLEALRGKDMGKLAELAHPQAGIRFSPYAYIDKAKDLTFDAERLRKLAADNQEYIWGAFDGSGEPIRLTFDGYHRRFIYDHDYRTAPEIAYNRLLGKGNTVNNIADVYPQGVFVEYHFPGFDPKAQGMDWASLRLIFEPLGEDYRLVGIQHDGWAI